MNFRNIDGTHLVAAIAAFCTLTAQAAPASGGGSDLRGVTQNWDKVLPTEPGAGCPNWSTRFTCVMNNAAVRDNETGLVWTHPRPYVMSWHIAKQECVNLAVGKRRA